jgi:hypothetical protein
MQMRFTKEIVITRNRHIWQLDEELAEGDKIRIYTAGGGGMFPGGLVGWEEGPEPIEWITVMEAQVRLGQRNQARQDRLITITRNGRQWDGGPPNILDTFRITAQGWGGAPKKKTNVPPPRPPPSPERKVQKKILIERCGYSQVFVINAHRPIQAITTQIAEEARIPNPSAWLLSTLNEEIIRDPREIVEGQTYRLKSSIRIEMDGRIKSFNIGEEEDGLMQHHRGLGTMIGQWEILDAQGA